MGSYEVRQKGSRLNVEISWRQYPYTLLTSALPSFGQSSAKPESRLKSCSLCFEDS